MCCSLLLMTRKSVLYSENKGLNPLGSSKFLSVY
nr:MAG TPA: hypothetical protein [Crassvirales sp.]DAX67913.1 MAG TPA: hypothetical protein [Crassvirales sp.]